MDFRLTWNPEDYEGIRKIAVVKKDTVWIPDCLPYDTYDINKRQNFFQYVICGHDARRSTDCECEIALVDD